MAVGSVAWTSYNSPKGRMLASLLLWHRAGGELVAFAAADLVEAMRKRLTMFVLRTKVAVSDRTSDSASVRRGRPWRRAQHSRPRSELRRYPGHGITVDDVDILATPDGRFIVRDGGRRSPRRCTARLALKDAPADYWNWLGIRSGVPTITRATQDLFVPQTTNFDLIGGIQFPQGLLPGPGNRCAHAVSRPPEGAPVRVSRRCAPRRHRQRRSSPKARKAPPARSSTPPPPPAAAATFSPLPRGPRSRQAIFALGLATARGLRRSHFLTPYRRQRRRAG